MGHYWLPIGFGLIVVALILLLTKLVSIHERRQTLRKLGLPTDAPLTGLQLRAFHAFTDTDVRLRNSFPGISDAQRERITRDVLHENGLLPRQKSAT
jgi:hypothetical protein